MLSRSTSVMPLKLPRFFNKKLLMNAPHARNR